MWELAPNLSAIVSGVTRSDVRALSRALTWVESRAPGVDELLAALFDVRGNPWRVGVTGAPGSGKSTLADAMIRELRREGKRIAVLAADPTSPFTGGAVLADRVRMLDHSADEGVYVRSMASRGSLGGLAPAAADALMVFAAARFDVVLIETVGVGQTEVDVAGLADQVALVLTPATGDDMQAMKAGVMEIADVYVINKADLPGADTLERHIQALLALRESAEPAPPIVKTRATDGYGVHELIARLRDRPADANRPRTYWRQWIVRSLTRGLAEAWIPRLTTEDEIEEAAALAASGAQNPYRWVRTLMQRAERT